MLKTLAVWGSPGSGKSTVSLALAWELVKDKQNVLVVNTDCTVPNLPVYLPMLKTNEDGNASIGTVLDSANRTQETLKNKIHLHEKSACLGFMALESGETPLSYKTFEKSKKYSFLKLLQAQPVDYIIFDCQSNPMYNNFT
ncbi:MAG: zeta toxin family protein, partial [Oscillospiraceae bacterium]